MDGSASVTHKFQADSGMTFQEVFDFAFKTFFIPTLQGLADELGEEYLETLKKGASEARLRRGRSAAENSPDNSLAEFCKGLREPDRLLAHGLERRIVEDTDAAFEMKVTECLWAKVFPENGAADIGYATCCHPDFAHAQGFNPSIRMIRSKTLMQGDDCCNHRWVIEE